MQRSIWGHKVSSGREDDRRRVSWWDRYDQTLRSDEKVREAGEVCTVSAMSVFDGLSLAAGWNLRILSDAQTQPTFRTLGEAKSGYFMARNCCCTWVCV